MPDHKQDRQSFCNLRFPGWEAPSQRTISADVWSRWNGMGVEDDGLHREPCMETDDSIMTMATAIRWRTSPARSPRRFTSYPMRSAKPR